MVLTRWKGIFPYLISSVDEYGKVREQVLRNLVEHLVGYGVHGLTPSDSTEEFSYLDREQRRGIVGIMVEATTGRMPMVAGVTTSINRDAVFRAAKFEWLGVDRILGILNVYLPLNQNGTYDRFASIVGTASCQVVIYNNPKFTGSEIEIPILKGLSQISNMDYCKDASDNIGRLLQLSNVAGDNLEIFSASAHVPVFIMMLGGAGWMAGPACLLPRGSITPYELCEKKHWDEAFRLQKIMWEVNRAFQEYNLTACVKAGLRSQGFSVGDSIPPNQPLATDTQREVAQVIEMIQKEFHTSRCMKLYFEYYFVSNIK